MSGTLAQHRHQAPSTKHQVSGTLAQHGHQAPGIRHWAHYPAWAFLHPLWLSLRSQDLAVLPSGRQDSEAQFRGRTLEVRVSSCSPGLFWNLLCRTGWPPTQRSTCLCLPNAGFKGMYDYHQGSRMLSKTTLTNRVPGPHYL